VKVEIRIGSTRFGKCCICGKNFELGNEGKELVIYLIEEASHKELKEVITAVNRLEMLFCRACYWKNFSIE
jgi:hypothetical protein